MFSHLQDALLSDVPLVCETHYQSQTVDIWLECRMSRVGDGVLMDISNNTAIHDQQAALKQSNEDLCRTNQALERTNKRLQTLQTIQRSLLNSSLRYDRSELAVLPLVHDLIPCQRISYLRFDEIAGLAHVDSKNG